MIVVNEKPNITHLPYEQGKSRGVFAFVPGQNKIEPDVWAAVKKTAGKAMSLHYGKFLKPIGEDIPDDEMPNPGQLNADEAIILIGGAMTLELLTAYTESENSRKGGARKTVMEAIERQAAQIQAIEDNKAGNK